MARRSAVLGTQTLYPLRILRGCHHGRRHLLLARADHERDQVAAGQGPFTFHGAARESPGQAMQYQAAAHWMLARSEDRSAARSAELAVDLTTQLLAPDADDTAARGLTLDHTIHATGLLRLRERERGLTWTQAARSDIDPPGAAGRRPGRCLTPSRSPAPTRGMRSDQHGGPTRMVVSSGVLPF